MSAATKRRWGGPPSGGSPASAGVHDDGSGTSPDKLRRGVVSWVQLLHLALTLGLLWGCVTTYRDSQRWRSEALARSTEHRGAQQPPLALSEEGGGAETLGSKKIQVDLLERRIERKDKELDETRQLLRHAEKDAKACHKRVDEAAAGANQPADPKWKTERTRLEKRDKAMQAMVARTQKSTADLSRALLAHEFGDTEVHKVEMTVGFPESMGAPAKGVVVIEMAPTSLMPTAVLYFLSQVEAGAWDGCAFIRNANHVLQADPSTPERKSRRHDFKTIVHQSESIPFQEYSADYPHKEFTVGLAGRPGGPDFYISTLDNTRNHGPGGQGSYDLPEEADTCFAKVVDGLDVVRRMHKAPRKKDSFQGLVEYIEIVEMRRILEP